MVNAVKTRATSTSTTAFPIPGRIPVRVDNIDDRLQDMVRIMAKVAARDFSEKPSLVEGDDTLALFSVGFRFMIEDLEGALAAVEKERSELQRANDQLKTLDRSKTRFINTAAHELGTPLTPIILQLALLRQGAHGPLTPAQDDSLAMLDRNMNRLAYLVKDMLDVARLQSRRMNLRINTCDLAALGRQCEQSFREQAASQGIQLTLEAPEHAYAPADENRINQVLFNLVSNALKFTPKDGQVRIEVREDRDGLRISVEDSGVGLGPDEIARLFQPFSQIHDAAARGTGLGLYISKGIMTLHGGRLRCESKGHGHGSRFEAWIPNHVAAHDVRDPAVTEGSL